MNGPTLPAGFEPMEHQAIITVSLFLLWFVVCACVNAFYPKPYEADGGLRAMILFQLILGPWAVYILAYEARHEELWGIWYRDPHVSIPGCVAAELIFFACAASLWRQERRKKGIWLLDEAIRLRAEGKHEAADAAGQEALKLLKDEARMMTAAGRGVED